MTFFVPLRLTKNGIWAAFAPESISPNGHSVQIVASFHVILPIADLSALKLIVHGRFRLFRN
jgi:hypothetical protein